MFYVDFDFDKNSEIVVINDKIKVIGAISYSLTKLNKENEYGLEEEILEIEGSLITNYYTQDITKLETCRYILDDIEVYKEEFGSREENIIYRFKAQYARVKYQTEFKVAETVRDDD